MKEKLKKLKPYFIGMTIGLFLVSSGVIADTIINSNNVAYKETTVKSALDDLYTLADSCSNSTSSNTTGVDTLMKLVSDTPTTREGCTGNGLFTKVTHNNGDVDYRYSGACPNNYVSFNNETWRIIGVFDGKIKIIRDDRITDRSYDNNTNNWETSTIKAYLNGTEDGSYYGSIDNNYKAMIAENVVWYLGGEWGTKEVMYGYERSGASDTISGTNPAASGTTKIGLVYLSDYGYAAEEGDSKCPATNILGYNDSTGYNVAGCKNNNWMYKNYNWWTLSSNSGGNVFYVHSFGHSNSSSPGYSRAVLPTLYLKSSVKISGGDGKTPDTAYILSI